MYIQNKHRKTYTTEFKLLAVNKYLSGECSVLQLCDEYNLGKSMVNRWIYAYKTKGGAQGLEDHRGRHGKHAGDRPKVNLKEDMVIVGFMIRCELNTH
jgi:transposase-like protein